MSDRQSGANKVVYWILGLIGSLLLLLAGLVVNQQINQVSQIIGRLDSLDRRVGMIEVGSAADVSGRIELNRRLSLIEADTREIRENIRKLY